MVKYISNRGREFNLLSFDYAKLKDADFNKYSWDKDVVAQQFGEIVNRFKKSAQYYACTFRLNGTPNERKAKIEAFNFESEYDIAHMKTGRLYINNTYIEGYWVEVDSYPEDNGQLYTTLKKTFYAPYPFWINEQVIEIFPTPESHEEEDTKGYKPLEGRYGYSYSYASAGNAVFIDTEHYKDSDFRMIAYGPAPSVQWTIGGSLYEVDYPLRDNQYMVIDSRQNTPADRQCYVVSESGNITNVFDYRNPEGDIFKKIPSGNSVLVYPRTYGLQLTIYKERSEPL